MRKRSARFHPFRIAFRFLFAAIVAAAVYFAGVSLLIQYKWKTSHGAQSDVIIVLGAAVWNGKPSPALRDRIETALDAWNRKLAPRIIATGGIGLPGEPSEAAVIKAYLVERGVPASAIYVEDQSRSTYENMQNSRAIMDQHGLRSAVLVTHGYHALRAHMIARMFDIEATVEPVQILPERLVHQTLRECGGIAYLLVTSPIRALSAVF
ncbi:MAG: YdcF family protein [Paenibacillus sp.]|jgi:uncharacterized SAM-binding protein YcdF (DUF218 family)|nr:YdcF family protein [Paenibacillus sp.]